MTGGDRYAGYLPQPGGEQQNWRPQWGNTDLRLEAGPRQLGFQRDGSFLNGRGETISLGFQTGDDGNVTSFRITAPGGRLLESGINQNGYWQTQNNMFDDLANVRLGRGRNGNDSYLAFERAGGKTDVWSASGRQYTVDARMPPMEASIPGDIRLSQPVVHAVAPDGSVSDYRYSQVRDGRGFRSQLESFARRDRNGNITEFSVRNNDGHSTNWVTFKPQPGESGLLAGMSNDQQDEILKRAEAIARDPSRNESPPFGLEGRIVSDPYKQIFAESVSRDGHLYQTAYNGETTCVGDNGKTYNWHANGLQSITITAADGSTRMLASDTSTLPEHGLVKDHYGYDAHGHINSLTETSAQRDEEGRPLWNAQYRRNGNQWETMQGRDWKPANVDIRNNSDGSVTIAQLDYPGLHNHENRALSARTIFPDGGETVSARTADGGLRPVEMLSATGDHSRLHYNQQGKLDAIDQSVRRIDGLIANVRYQPDPEHPGHWQKISENGARCEDIKAPPTVGTGEISFGGYARIDHRGDLSYAQGMAARMPEQYADAVDSGQWQGDNYYGIRRYPHFRLPSFLLPRGARPSDFIDQPGHRMTRVGYESYYQAVAPVQTPSQLMPWQWAGYPGANARPYYSRRQNYI